MLILTWIISLLSLSVSGAAILISHRRLSKLHMTISAMNKAAENCAVLNDVVWSDAKTITTKGGKQLLTLNGVKAMALDLAVDGPKVGAEGKPKG